MLHIVLPVHNRCAVTEGFVRALRAQTYADYRLMLIDDGCTDGTVDRVRGMLPAQRLIVLRGDGHLWWAGALQQAYRRLCAEPLEERDAVLIINDDVRFAEDFLQQGLAVLHDRPDYCIQAIGLDPERGIVDRGAIADLRRLQFRAAGKDEVPNCLSTRGLLMSGGTFKRSGGLRPRWLPHYLSDYEFTLRLKRRGFRLTVDPRFSAQVNFALTGLETLTATTIGGRWTQAMSNRSKLNPRHWSAFVLLCCPVWTVPAHLARIWWGFARSLAAEPSHRDPLVR